jgi:hypothetical protein
MPGAALKVIATCSVVSAAILVGGALFLLNDRYDWTGQLSDWNSLRQAKGRNAEFWELETKQARLLVGDEKLAFLVRVCRPEPTDHPPNGFEATCIGSIAEDMNKDCSGALKKWPDAGTEYLREQSAGSLKFVCRTLPQTPTSGIVLPNLK